MSKKDKIVLIIIGTLIVLPILINEIKEYNLRSLKKEVYNISEALKNTSSGLTQMNINKTINIKGKEFKTRGKGEAFINKGQVTLIISYRGYCAVKLPIINDVALSKSKCPKIELIKGTVIPIVEKDGLIKKDSNYYYRGNADNYLKFNNELWRILSIENNHIKIIKDEFAFEMNRESVLNYLNKEYFSKLDSSFISATSLDISNIIIKNTIDKKEDKKIIQKVGILSLADYINTLNDECKIKNSNLVCSKSYATKKMWLSNFNEQKGYYVYEDGNIYVDIVTEDKNIYPVLTLKETINIVSGSGLKDDPYIIK